MPNLINKNWVFGDFAGLNFGTPIPTASGGFALSAFEGCASISDANGNLLFYTEGTIVWDASHTPKPTAASGLAGHNSSTQSAIIVPDPGNSNSYYVFTADGCSGSNQHFSGLRLDVSNWSSIPLANLISLPGNTDRSPTEKVTAIQHRNCKDYWVLTMVQGKPGIAPHAKTGPGIFRTFLVDSSGVHYIGETPLPGITPIDVEDQGYLKGSPNGARIAVANYDLQNVLLFDFDNALGVVDVNSLVTIAVPPIPGPTDDPHPRTVYGVEFSPNSDILYYSLLGTKTSGQSGRGFVFQVDLTNLAQTQIIVRLNPSLPAGKYNIGALQLGIDGRIYIAIDQEKRIGAIKKPNVLGGGPTGCDPDINFLSLPGGPPRSRLGLPNLISNLCDCPCESGACDEQVKNANQILNDRADLKQFTIVANGQTLPALCELAFTNANFAPVFTLEWGDGPSDQFESEDFEVIYICVHNPFLNLILRNLTIFNITIMPNQTLPSGEDALQIIPAEIACFDELQPCAHVCRDFAFVIDHALVGPYHISFDYCIEEIAIVKTEEGKAEFDIDVVAS